MQAQPDVHTISKAAPPSYEEAMGQSVQMRNVPYVPTSGQPTTYDQGCPQMPGYPSFASLPQNSSNSYTNMPAQTPYVGQSQQSHPAAVDCIVNTDALPPTEQTFCENCAICKKILITIFVAVMILFLVRLIVFLVKIIMFTFVTF